MKKILWFVQTDSFYDQTRHHYYGGGWIGALEQVIRQKNEFELAVSFFTIRDYGSETTGQELFYPMKIRSNKKHPARYLVQSVRASNGPKREELKQVHRVVEAYKPDLIQVFGTESALLGMIGQTDIPVVVYLQGLINPVYNSFFPPGHAACQALFSRHFFLKHLVGQGLYQSYRRNRKMAEREALYLKQTDYILGRTNWDRMMCRLMAEKARYFHVNEVLRDVFYLSHKQDYAQASAIQLVTTLSPTIYKGIDVVLKCAALLDRYTEIPFRWLVVGMDERNSMLRYFQGRTKAGRISKHMQFVGKKNAEELSGLLVSSDLYVHPSYMDNSPNSLCEAQMVGLPVIAQHTGGVSSLVEHEVNGCLVPANGIYEMAAAIIQLAKDAKKREAMGRRARKDAMERHNRDAIYSDLKTAYGDIISDNTDKWSNKTRIIPKF